MPDPADADPAEYVAAWLDGWWRSRGTPEPERVDGGWYVATGSAWEACRYLHDPAHDDLDGWVADLLARPLPPRACLKLSGDPEVWLPRFPPGWEYAGGGWYMVRALDTASPVPRRLPPGYVLLETTSTPDLVAVEVLAEDGELAARGQVGLGPTYAVPDRVVTTEGHRRLGLGSAVMAHLEQASLDAGRTRAVLAATDQGRALYTRLGWVTGAPQVGMYLGPEPPQDA